MSWKKLRGHLRGNYLKGLKSEGWGPPRLSLKPWRNGPINPGECCPSSTKLINSSLHFLGFQFFSFLSIFINMAISYHIPQPHAAAGKRKGHRENSLRRRCLLMVKQQKTRFYILRRCISMLLCWHDHAIRD